MCKALFDQYEAVTLSNEQNIFLNDLSSCDSDISIVQKYNKYIIMITKQINIIFKIMYQ